MIMVFCTWQDQIHVAALFREELVLKIILSTKDGIFTQFEHMVRESWKDPVEIVY